MQKTIRQYLDDVYCFNGFVRVRWIYASFQESVNGVEASLVGSEANLTLRSAVF